MPEDIVFATKTEIARHLIAAALDAGAPCRWILADRLRRMLEERRQPYVSAVRSNHHLRFLTREGLVETDSRTIGKDLPAEVWTALAAGEGAKGLGLYDWARIALPWSTDEGFERWLLIRRSRREPDKRAHYLVFAPEATPFAELAGAVGLRCTIEECLQRAKGELGLDHCEPRSWCGWHRHMSLVMAALAFFTKLTVDLKRTAWSKPNKKIPTGTIAA